MIFQKEINIRSKAFDSIYNITDEVNSLISESGIKNGIVNIFHIGSTASITTIEFFVHGWTYAAQNRKFESGEPGLEKDMKLHLNRIFPRGEDYFHNQTWNDGNGDGHLKASFIGPSITCPVKNNQIILGTWQQVILIDSDNKPRTRRVFITIIGE